MLFRSTNNRQQAGNGNGRSTLAEFKKHAPPTFIEPAEPLDADDWVRSIEEILELVGCTEDREKVAYAAHCLGGTARAWWDGFKVMHAEQDITWVNFKAEFRKAHIPSGIMAIKKREFRALNQGMALSRSTCRSSVFCQGMPLKMSALMLQKGSASWKA